MEAAEEKNTQIVNDRKQLVIFELSGEEYAVDITQSKQIIKVGKVTNVPNTPDYVRGVINLRGQIVPVVDLRKRFKISGKAEKEKIITVEVRESLIGLIVDTVNEVFWFDVDEIEPAPDVEGTIKQEFVRGVLKRDGRLLVLIELESLLFEDKVQNGDISV